MQIIKLALLAGLIAGLNAPARAEGLRFKDGRSFHLELVRRLGLDEKEMSKVFSDLRQSIPKQKGESDLMAGMNGLAKLASQACTEAAYFEEEADVGALYMKILDRAATKEEIEKAIKNEEGRPGFYANCFLLAMHPEFILLKRGGKK